MQKDWGPEHGARKVRGRIQVDIHPKLDLCLLASEQFFNHLYILFIQQCFLYIFDLQVFLPRMQDKIKSEINHLQQSHDAIEKAYNCGIIDGFSKGPLS